MKTHIQSLFLVPGLIVGLGLMRANRATAQTYSVIKSFGVLTNMTGRHPEAPLAQAPDGTLYGTTTGAAGAVGGTVFKLNSDGTGFTVLKWFTNSVEGSDPYGELVLSGSTLYGTTYSGGSSGGDGTVFKLNTNGSGFTVLKIFTNNPDGAFPSAGLILSGSTLYGTTQQGGSFGRGTVFKVNTNGSGYTILKNCTDSDGAYPFGGLTLAGSTLYGTTDGGGSSGVGTVFKVNTDGSGYAVLNNFTDNPDGARPAAGLTLSGGTLYGTTYEGGGSGYGTVFKINTNGSGYIVLTNFSVSDGASPAAGLILSGGTLYGTTEQGGSFGAGTVFQINTNGSGFTVLKDCIDSDGTRPLAGLTLSGGTLYGTTYSGGSSDSGTVFKINTNGSGYTVLKNFTYSDGATLYGGVALSGSTLYGTTYEGGSSGRGTVFKVNTDGSGYTVLKNCTSSDGAFPRAGLTLSGSTLYGTAQSGGSFNAGTVFKVNTNGSGYFLLTEFGGITNGALPYAGVALSGGTLYGTTDGGGSSGVGTVFKVNTDGSGYTVLNTFTNSPDGAYPDAAVTLFGSTLYGTTASGGSSDSGTVFKINTNGSGYVVLKHFTDSTNGENPSASLTLSGSTLFGTTTGGGDSGYGTVFKVNTDGSGFTVLKHFTGSPDGAYPYADLTLSGSTLYGTTERGGSSDYGTVFKINTNGSGFAVIKSFTHTPDGAYPYAGLTLSGGTLYGTTAFGGSLGDGVVFSLSLAGPPLTIARSAGNVILTWPTNVSSFTLQSTTNLVLPAWSTVSPAPVVVNGQYTVTNAISDTRRFYRLTN